MFVLTVGKKGLRRVGAVALCGVVLAGAVFAVGSFFRSDEALAVGAEGAGPAVNVKEMKIQGADSISAFFQSFGLEVDLATTTVDKVKIPKKWDESFSAFNTVVKESGLDLKDNKGKTVEKWLVLCPAKSSGDQKCYGVLLVYKEKPVGAYLLNQPSGEVLGLASAAQTAAPLSEEQAAETAAEFGAETQETAGQTEEAVETSADEPMEAMPEGEQPVEEASADEVQEWEEASADMEAGFNLDEVGEMPVE